MPSAVSVKPEDVRQSLVVQPTCTPVESVAAAQPQEINVSGQKRHGDNVHEFHSKKQKTRVETSDGAFAKAISTPKLKPGTSSHPSTSTFTCTTGMTEKPSAKKKSIVTRKPATSATSKPNTGTSKVAEKEETETRPERILKTLKSKLKLAIAQFLSQSILSFDKRSIILQTRDPLIHKLKSELEGLLRDILSKFVTPQAIVAVSDLTLVEYKVKENLKEESEVVIGSETRDTVGSLNQADRQKFFAAIYSYYSKVCDYIIAKFPLKSNVVIHAQVADVSGRINAKFNSVMFFIEMFPSMLLIKEAENRHSALDALEEQFVSYQIAQIPESVLREERADQQWAMLMALKSPSGELRYDRLGRVMLGILTIPHTNAECERVFSQVRKNKTDFRGSMNNETLSSVLITKSQQTGPCYLTEFDDKFLRRAKSATYRALNE